jgi:hypothetical protein
MARKKSENNNFEDHTANVIPPDEVNGVSDPIKDGRRSAELNAKAEQKVNGPNPYENDELGDKNIKDAQEAAELNHKADLENQPEGHEIAKNDTSKAGKVRTTKSQLDPAGNDPVNDAELKRAATDGTSVKGGTSVDNEDVADRAKQPGKVEEENPKSTAHGNLDPKELEASEEAKHTNANENERTGEGGIEEETGPANQS